MDGTARNIFDDAVVSRSAELSGTTRYSIIMHKICVRTSACVRARVCVCVFVRVRARAYLYYVHVYVHHYIHVNGKEHKEHNNNNITTGQRAPHKSANAFQSNFIYDTSPPRVDDNILRPTRTFEPLCSAVFRCDGAEWRTRDRDQSQQYELRALRPCAAIYAALRISSPYRPKSQHYRRQ